MALALLSARYQSLPPLPSSKLGSSGADSRVGRVVYILGPYRSLQWTLLWGLEFLLLPPQPPLVFSVRGLRLYFPAMEPWVAQSVSLPSCSSQFICMWMWDHPLHQLLPHWVLQPPPCQESSLPGCPSPPSYRSGWMFLLYLLGCRTSIQFDFLSVLVVFLFLNCCCLLVVRGGTVCLPMSPSWPEVSA